jgi:hypothetical protein
MPCIGISALAGFWSLVSEPAIWHQLNIFRFMKGKDYDDGVNMSDHSETSVPQTWKGFVEFHPSFPSMMEKWIKLIRMLLMKSPDGTSDDLGFLICGFMAESRVDLNDILTLVHAGSSSGAQKILRSMYERTVTMKYLYEHPSEVENFIEYQSIDWQQVVNACLEKTGEELDEPARTRLASAAADARKKFKGETCLTCKQRKQTSWTPKSVKELSEITGLFHLHAYSFIFPSKSMHPTFWGVIKFLERESPIYNILNCAHELLVHNLLIHRRHFAKNLQPTPMMKAAVNDFVKIWIFAETSFDGLLTNLR